MNAKHDVSVNVLRMESERTRAALAGTVSELRENVANTVADIKTRVSPAHIKQELKDYVREESQDLADLLQHKVRENPLQAVAIGVALAYPLWGMLRTIPAPLMMVGAGLWFVTNRGKKTADLVTSKAGELAGTAVDQVSDTAASMQAKAGQTFNRISDAVTDGSTTLALQLPCFFTVRALSDRLVSSAPE